MLPVSLLSFITFKITAHHEKRLCGSVALKAHNLGVIMWFICINEEKILAIIGKTEMERTKKNQQNSKKSLEAKLYVWVIHKVRHERH